MFGDERSSEGWSPFSVKRKPVESARVINPNGALEINPIQIVSRHDRALVQQVDSRQEEEAEAPADVDPKASSATSSASDSEVDSDENGNSQTPTQNPSHPSSLPPDQDNHVSAEKVQSLVLVPLTPPTNPGPS